MPEGGSRFVGSMVTFVALPYQAYQLSHSSLIVGLLSLAELAPLLVTAFVGGALADAVDRRGLIRWTEAGMCVVSALFRSDARERRVRAGRWAARLEGDDRVGRRGVPGRLCLVVGRVAGVLAVRLAKGSPSSVRRRRRRRRGHW